MKRSSIALFGVLIALAVIVVAAVRAQRVAAAANPTAAPSLAAGKHSQDDSSNDEDKVTVIRFARNAAPAPPFLVSDLDGNIISTAGLRGKVVLLNFWATWCPPCRDEIPEMIELQSRYKDRLEIVGVSMDDDPPDAVKQFAKEAGINYPIVMGAQISTEYGGVPALPTSFVVNPDGRVVQKHVGLYPIEVYEAEVRALLGLPISVPVETFEDTGQIFLKNAALATELPGVDFKGLTPIEKRAVLKRMNSETCTCGCKLTIAQCRINEGSCSTSHDLAAKIIREILAGKNPPPTAINR
ncbi:MAG: TlpA disulfide reductase family protein [Candidatus Acidiferrales bacterium]